MINMTLKRKYRIKNYKVVMQPIHPSGQIETKVVQLSGFKSKSSNSGGKAKKNAKKLRPRRRVYGPF